MLKWNFITWRTVLYSKERLKYGCHHHQEDTAAKPGSRNFADFGYNPLEYRLHEPVPKYRTNIQPGDGNQPRCGVDRKR